MLAETAFTDLAKPTVCFKPVTQAPWDGQSEEQNQAQWIKFNKTRLSK
jgi:hypothetical protein